MALQPIVASSDGARTTVSDLVKSPRVIPRRMLELTRSQYIVDSVLRAGGDAPGGVVSFYESTPLFLDGSAPGTAAAAVVKPEFGEYRIMTSSEGQQRLVVSINRGLAIRVSEDMRRRNQIERVSIQMTQAKNTLTRTWDMAFRDALLLNASVPFFNASGTAEGWEAADADIRRDIMLAKQMVANSQAGASTEDFLGFVADTMVCSYTTAQVILGNTKFQDVYHGNLADENVLYTGKLPNQIQDLTVLQSRTWPDNLVWVGERGTIGFIANERPERWTPLRYDEDRETWRSNGSRISAIGIDQPKAGVFIKNVLGVDGVIG